MITMNKVKLVLEELRRQMPNYDAYYKMYDDVAEDLDNYSHSGFCVEYDIYADDLGDLLTEALEADLVWPDDAEPSLHYVAEWDSDSGVFELQTFVDIDSTSHTSRALEKVRRESEVGQPANAEDFNWRQYEVSIVIEVE